MRYGLNRYFDGVSGELTSGRVDGEVWSGELWAELAPEQQRMQVRMVPLNR